jgi:hypothetical protein
MTHLRQRHGGPAPTALGWILVGCVVTLVVWALIVGYVLSRVRSAEAEELDPTVTPAPTWTAEAERYEPVSRGGRDLDPVERWRGLVEQYDWDVETALRVIRCESRGDPGVYNAQGSGAVGLFQTLGWQTLAWRLVGTGDLTIPEVNVAVAHFLWRDSGGTFRFHWYASRRCWS